jgi:hypothetical protein
MDGIARCIKNRAKELYFIYQFKRLTLNLFNFRNNYHENKTGTKLADYDGYSGMLSGIYYRLTKNFFMAK